MQIVIEIPEEAYEFAKACKSRSVPRRYSWRLSYNDVIFMIANGTPLPKDHGDLIDRKTLTPDRDYDDGVFGAVSCQQIVEAEAVIEADTEENDVSEYRQVGKVSDILEIIDKYKAGRGQ